MMLVLKQLLVLKRRRRRHSRLSPVALASVALTPETLPPAKR